MNALEKPIHAGLGLLSMAVGVAVCDAAFFGFLLAGPFIIAGFVFCVKSAMAMVNLELSSSRRLSGALFVVIGIVLLVMSFGAALDIVGPVGQEISRHQDALPKAGQEESWNPLASMRSVTLGDLGIWLAPPLVIVLGQRLRSKAAWRQLLVSAACWAVYLPFTAGAFILFAVLGWESGN